MTDFLLFGLWSLSCVLLGAWLMHRKQISAPPFPDMYDVGKALTWVRTGKTEPNPGDDAPPKPEKHPTQFEL